MYTEADCFFSRTRLEKTQVLNAINPRKPNPYCSPDAIGRLPLFTSGFESCNEAGSLNLHKTPQQLVLLPPHTLRTIFTLFQDEIVIPSAAFLFAVTFS